MLNISALTFFILNQYLHKLKIIKHSFNLQNRKIFCNMKYLPFIKSTIIKVIKQDITMTKDYYIKHSINL